MKDEQQHEQTPKQFLSLTLTCKIVHLGPKKNQDLDQKHKFFSFMIIPQNSFYNNFLVPKNNQPRPQRAKSTHKLSQNQISELEETQKVKVLALYEQTLKECLNLIPTPKIAHFTDSNIHMIISMQWSICQTHRIAHFASSEYDYNVRDNDFF